MLWRTAAMYEADRHLRQDLYQEIVLAVWRSLPRLRDRAKLRTWLARIAHNRGVSHVQREIAQPRRSDIEPDELRGSTPGPDHQLEIATERARLLHAVRSLPVGWQQVVSLTLENFPPRDIADVLGLPVNAVSIRLTRAKQALRELLKEDGNDD